MKIFLDTANISEIKAADEFGLIDGVTTNPTLLAREGGDWKKQAEKICSLVHGPVNLEVVATDAPGMLKEGRELLRFGQNVVVKIPMTMEGLKAVKAFSSEGVPTNVTLIFSANQALLAAKAGASYVSPFVGRLDGIGHTGMEIVSDILTINSNYGFATEVIVASIRHPGHVLESALMGADVATLPYKVLSQLASHPLTDSGLETFLKDWSAFEKM